MEWVWIAIVFAFVVPAAIHGSRHGMRYGMKYGLRWGLGAWEGDDQGPRARERVQALEAELDRRMEELRALEARVNELENRMDFTERLLASGAKQ
jgi:hypothetical protein